MAEMRAIHRAKTESEAAAVIEWWNAWPNPQHQTVTEFVREARKMMSNGTLDRRVMHRDCEGNHDFETPDGEKLEVWLGAEYQSEQWPPVMNWRGVGDLARLRAFLPQNVELMRGRDSD